MVNVWLKRGVFGLVALLLAAVLGLAIFLLTFNPNSYKSRLEALVYSRFDRTLTIDGDISLSLFPRIGLSVNQVALSDRDSSDTFISMDNARFAVAIWPLLSNQLVVDHVSVTGLKAWVVRDKQGRFNFSDLLRSDANGAGAGSASAPGSGVGAAIAGPIAASRAVPGDFNIDIAGLEIKDGQIQYVDQGSGHSTSLTGIEANTGRITYDQPFDVSLKANIAGDDPIQDARLEAQALLRLAPAQHAVSASKIQVQLNGRLGNLDKAKTSLQGNLSYQGEARNFSADHLELSIDGNIVGHHPISGLKARLTADQLHVDAPNSELKVSKLALRAQGRDGDHDGELALDAPALALSPKIAKADPVTGTLKWTGDDTLAVSLGLEGLSGNASDLQFSSVNLDAGLTQGKRLLHLKLSSPLAWDVSLRKGGLSAIKGDMGVRDRALPHGAYEFPLIGSARMDLVQDVLDLDLNAVIDGEQAAFKSHTVHLAQPQTEFNLQADKLDLNRWLPAAAAQKSEEAGEAGKNGKNKADDPKPADKKPADKTPSGDAGSPPASRPLDLSFLKGKDVQGTLRVGDLLLRDVQLKDLTSQLTVRKGTLTLSKIAAQLYEGTLAGQLSATTNQNFTADLKLDKLAVAPLLQALAGLDVLSGHGAAQAKFEAQGGTLADLEKTLTGQLSWQVREGAVHGVDASRTLADVSSALGNVLKGRMDALGSPFDKRRSTPFSRLDGRLDVKDGLGTLSQLSVISDLVRVSPGKPAQIDIPAQSLDVVLRAQVAVRPPKALTADVGALLGATIPIRVAGPWAKPQFTVLWADIANPGIRKALKSGLIDLLQGKDLIQEALPDVVPDVTVPVPGSVGKSQKKDPVEQIGKAIKGLLGQ